MIRDYNGADVVDATGERIGTVERSYVDDDGAVRVVGVKLGRLFAKHRLVPVDGLSPRDDDTLRIPYSKQMVEDSPEVDADDDLAGEVLERVRLHYATLRELPDARDTPGESIRPEVQAAGVHTGTESEPGSVTSIHDLGDVIEVPIVEERVVKQPVVKEVLRIRKETLTRRQPVETTLRREELVVDQEGDVAVTTEDDAERAVDQEPRPAPAEQHHVTDQQSVPARATERSERA